MIAVDSRDAHCNIADRFAHLLNPIRDLAKNWDIDIACYLEEYLSELEMVAITFDGGKTVMNFAEAALLIQGSACVYSKKVDFLYSLVLQLLDVLRCKKTSSKSTKENEENVQDDNRDESEEFLALDDFEDDGSNVMKQDENRFETYTRTMQLPKIPSALIPLDKHEKRNTNVLKNLKGELLGNRDDFLMNLMNLDHSGCLHYYGGKTSNTSLSQQPVLSGSSQESRGKEDNERIGSDLVANNDDSASVDNDAAGADDYPVDEIADNLSCQQQVEENEIAPETNKLVKRPDATTKSVENARLAWTPVDVHEEMRMKLRPARKGKTINEMKITGTGVVRFSSKRRKLKHVNQDQLESITVFCTKAFYSRASKFAKEQRVPLCLSLEYAYYEELKRQKGLLQNLKSTLNKNSNGSEELERMADSEDDGMDFPVDGNDGDFDFIENRSDIVSPELHNESLLGCHGKKDQYENDLDLTVNYEKLIMKHTEEALAAAKEHFTVSNVAKKVKAWEDSLLPVLEEENARDVYDIRHYSSAILDKFASDNRKQTMSFSKVVDSLPSYEICRYFLASLQLANNYNIEIQCNDKELNIPSNVEFTLLSHRQHFEDFQ